MRGTFEDNSLELKYLVHDKGFMINCFDDGSSFWLVKKIKHKMFKNLEISVQDYRDELILSVDCDDVCDDDSLTIIQTKYSRKNLKKILKLFKDGENKKNYKGTENS